MNTIRKPVRLWNRLATVVAALACCAPCLAGHYEVTFPDDKLTGEVVTTPPTGAGSTTRYFPGFVTDIKGDCGGGGNAPLGGRIECKGNIVARFKWTPDYVGERKPDFLVLKERAVAQWTGSSMTYCDNGWGSPLGSATQSGGFTLQATDPHYSDRWVVIQDPGDVFDRTITPHIVASKVSGGGGGGTGSGGTSVVGIGKLHALGSGPMPMISGETYAYYQVLEKDDVSLNLQGVQPLLRSSQSYLDSILISQQLVAQVDMGGLADSHDTFTWTKPSGGEPVSDYKITYRPPFATTVVTAASSPTQLLNDANGILVGDTIRFSQAGSDAKVLSISSTTVTLDRTVTTVANEAVTRAALSSGQPVDWSPPSTTSKTSSCYFTQPATGSPVVACTVHSGKMNASLSLQKQIAVESPTIKDSWTDPTSKVVTQADKSIGQLTLRNDKLQTTLADVHTTVTTGATGTKQTVASSAGMNQGDPLYFSGENVYRTVSSVIDAVTVILDSAITTTTGEEIESGPTQFVLDGASHPGFPSWGIYYDTWVETPGKYYNQGPVFTSHPINPGLFEWVQLVTDTSTYVYLGATENSDGLQYLDDRIPYLGESSPSGAPEDQQIAGAQSSLTWLTFTDRPGFYAAQPANGLPVNSFGSLGYSMIYQKQSFDLYDMYSGPLNEQAPPILVPLRLIPWQAFRQATLDPTSSRWVLGSPDSSLDPTKEVQNPSPLPSWVRVKTSPPK